MVQGGYRIAAGAEAGANMASSAALRELQRELETKANDLSKLQKDIAKNHQVRKKYTIQLGENELVLKELDLLNEDANVYKLIGPVLVKQDLAEANANVRKRIDYISAELKRLDATLQDLDEKQNSKKDMILKLQQRIQSLQAGKAKA
ncbi:prefoldin subunit 6 isoform X2 [Malania oleifera]|uniref:prefoldin subunit 6 isoform X2 n=1 Tax=Malania oleifera TaxID=397392 RepID=UPI0025AEB752|nr:prefoldin subunit 6 isoform X2 [Malania oleifera]XP_057947903.1 prefoldin subunit 6 isoform X2 [Malania oleifera]XP_057947904.1 prefoldin subunit 6 isoform X2 [Malania oleifera]XP_057947905.1 prefoldin subunit 6 isoform X2 [Malania oleifera]